jgi:hypothetical protein
VRVIQGGGRPWVLHLVAYGHEQHVACRPGDPSLRARTRKVERVTCRNCLRTIERRIGLALARLGEEGAA